MADLERVEERLTLRMEAMEHRLLAGFRHELLTTQLASIVAVAGAVIAAAKIL